MFIKRKEKGPRLSNEKDVKGKLMDRAPRIRIEQRSGAGLWASGRIGMRVVYHSPDGLVNSKELKIRDSTGEIRPDIIGIITK